MKNHNLITGLITCALSAGIQQLPLMAQGGFTGPGRYEIANLKSGKVIDLDRNDQTTVIQFSSRGTPNQMWEIRPAPGGFFFLRNAMNGNALEVESDRNSSPVRGAPFNGSDRQQWRLEPGKDGNLLIMSRFGKTLDIPDGTDRDGVRIQIYDPNGDSNQRFVFRRLSGDRRADWDRDREGPGPGGMITCSSDDGRRAFCQADTRGGVQMVRQISGSPCRQGRSWGFDARGIWVDRGCRAEFSVGGGGDRGDAGNMQVTCSSDNGQRVYCEVETRGRRVQLMRQISGSPCREGETWGSDRRGIWVDRGCRAEFAVGR